MKRTNDETIFVFERTGEPRGDLVYATPELNRRPLAMLATSPTQFSPCYNVQRAQMHQRPPYQLTNQGLEIRLGHAYVESPTSGKTILLALNCTRSDSITDFTTSDGSSLYWIVLQWEDCGHYVVKDATFDSPSGTALKARESGPNPEWVWGKEDDTIWVHTSDEEGLNLKIVCS
ncbi:hypothetical protein LTS10_002998 [Elasticomyces elasticus]|nr:hypothetical protein LTS10_002998 [Elasticomyces elasticus]